jgi:hypothetical protein
MEEMAESGSDRVCTWCGEAHEGACARVHTIEYYPGGGIKVVRFWSPTPVPGSDGQVGQLGELGLQPLQENDREFILALGEGGPTLRKALMEEVAERRGGISPQAGSIKRALRRVRETGLLTEERVQLPGGGFHEGSLLLGLSQRGAGLYLFLTGEEPAQGEREAGQAGGQVGK